jgi:hypothetical protein
MKKPGKIRHEWDIYSNGYIYIYDNGNMDNGNTVSDIHGKIPQG